MNKKNELVKNTLIIALGKMPTQLISLILLPIYTIFLSPSEYGLVDLIINYVILLAPAITIQLEMASFRFLIEARNDELKKQKIISNVLWMVILILLVCTIPFAIFSYFIHIQYANFAIFYALITVFSNIFLQFARGLGENKKYSIAGIFTAIFTLCLSLLLIVYLGMGAKGMLLSLALANLACCVYLFFSLKIHKYINLKSRDGALQKQLIKYSSPLVPNGISWWAINVSDRTIISVFISVAANGIYAVANKYAAIFSSIFAVFSMSWTESISLHINDKDKDDFFSEIVNDSIQLFGCLGLLLIAYIPLIFSYIVDKKFNEAYLYIPILVIAAFFKSIVELYSAIYIAKKLTKKVALTSVVAAIINITINLALIKYIGIYAAAFSTVIAYLAMAIYRHYDIKKHISVVYKRGLFAVISLLYVFVLIFYYYNSFIGNVMSAIVMTCIVVLLNRSAIGDIKNKVLNSTKAKKDSLTPDQQVEVYEKIV